MKRTYEIALRPPEDGGGLLLRLFGDDQEVFTHTFIVSDRMTARDALDNAMIIAERWVGLSAMIKLTTHAEEMLEDRKIALAWVAETIEQPERQMIDPNDSTLTRSYRRIAAAGGRVLRVVHRPEGADTLIVTVFFDGRARL